MVQQPLEDQRRRVFQLWQHIEQTHGLLTQAEVEQRTGLPDPDAAGLLAVTRGRTRLFPDFSSATQACGPEGDN